MEQWMLLDLLKGYLMVHESQSDYQMVLMTDKKILKDFHLGMMWDHQLVKQMECWKDWHLGWQ
jgi:hypothetical protein